ncbi:MAG: ABC transporter permease [Gemmatales bacterium]|nr:ABC transporter permease [Gemmatales bacterium]
MTLGKLWRRNLRYHRRSHLAILLGTVIGCMALTGAWLVGDLLRARMNALQQQRLGFIQYALTNSRFFTSTLAQRLATELDRPSWTVVPVVQLRGTVILRDTDGRILRHQNKIQVLGVPPEFWKLFAAPVPDLTGAVAVNQALARQLQLDQNALLEIRLPRPSIIPQETLAGRSIDETGTAWQASINIESRQVRTLIPAQQGGAFTLAPQSEEPYTVYLPLDDLQRRLRDALAVEAPANVVLVGTTEPQSSVEVSQLSEALHRAVRLEDYGLKLRIHHSPFQYASLETNRLLLEDELTQVAQDVAQELQWSARPTLTYLVNVIWSDDWPAVLSSALGTFGHDPTPLQAMLCWRMCYTYVPYLTVSVLDPSEDAPWGPFYSWNGQRWTRHLSPGEILLTEPAADDLWPVGSWQARLRQEQELPDVFVRYFVESSGWLLEEKTARLRVAGVLSWRGSAVDPGLTPEFPGLRGTSPADWQPPFPRSQWHPRWIRGADDLHWRRYRAAPRAFISAETARRLGWFSRHGQYTSVRLTTAAATNLDTTTVQAFAKHLLSKLDPQRQGFRWRHLRAEAEAAIDQGPLRMFRWLFLGFSVFLVGSALLLIVLLVRLQLLRRASELGVLSALGYSRGLLNRLIGTEFGIVLVLGCLAGIPAAVIYAWGLLLWIDKRWPTSVTLLSELSATEMRQYLLSPTLIAGWAVSVLAGGIALIWALRDLRRFSPRELLLGRFQAEISAAKPGHSRLRTIAFLLFSSILGLLIWVSGLRAAPQHVPLWFFASGGIWLVTSLAVVAWILRQAKPDLVRHPWWLALGFRFLTRQPRRNFFTVTLLALTTFMLSAIEVFYKSPQSQVFAKESGTGGFALLAESDIPLPIVPKDLADWQAILGEDSAERLHNLLDALQRGQVHIYGFAVRPGEDVSCLNLYQPQQPRLLGVPARLRDRGGFRFDKVMPALESGSVNPWLALNATAASSDAIPVFADAHTAQWVLHLALGQTFPYAGESNGRLKLRLTGLLADSIFQGSLLISEENFRRHFPQHSGYAFFLIESSPEAPLEEITRCLESALGEKYGFSVRPTLEVLGQYHRVENLYLQTFQLLGAFGLILGAGGLAAVLLRNVYERQTELALLQALGYTPRMLACLVVVENALVVLLGFAAGLLAALVSVAPYLYIVGNITEPLKRLSIILAIVIGIGSLSGSVAIRHVLRLRMLALLRRE